MPPREKKKGAPRLDVRCTLFCLLMGEMKLGKRTVDREILETLYFTQGKSISQISKELGCHKTTVAKLLQNLFGDRYKAEVERRKKKEKVTGEYIRKYLDKGYKVSDIACKIGCDVSTVRKALKRHFIPIDSKRKIIDEVLPKEKLHEMYFSRGLEVSEIARITGCDSSTIRKALKKFYKDEYERIAKERKEGKKMKESLLKEERETIDHWMEMAHYYATKELSVKPKNPINSIYAYVSSQYIISNNKKYLKYADGNTKPNDLPTRIPLIVF